MPFPTRRRRAVTLLELFVFVALLAIVLLVLAPTRRGEAQIRSRPSRAQADQRSMATALAGYYVDHDGYPLAMVASHSDTRVGNSLASPAALLAVPARPVDRRDDVRPDTAWLGERRATFAHPGAAEGEPGWFATLTTPIAYITRYFPDPFGPQKALTFSYLPDRQGFLLATFQPELHRAPNPTRLSALADEMRRQFVAGVAEPFDGAAIADSKTRLRVGTHRDGRAYTFDPTNGTRSEGSVFRISD